MRRKILLFALCVLVLATLACSGSSIGQPATVAQPRLTIVSAVQGKDGGGHTQSVFVVRNDGPTQVRYVKVRGDCYRGGVVVATAWSYSSPEHLDPGQTGSNRIQFDPGVTCDSIKVYPVTTN